MTFAKYFFLTLFVLKVLGYLTWSWWWIASPVLFEYSIILINEIIEVSAKQSKRGGK
jgi:hypothetical protein